mmetsp:Transcript_75679/g.219770  ORF Transcript_75679/g.219770 Transcript_75679/m.219770 type:complete len:295 (+) Transcript_75679:495-1379(+)
MSRGAESCGALPACAFGRGAGNRAETSLDTVSSALRLRRSSRKCSAASCSSAKNRLRRCGAPCAGSGADGTRSTEKVRWRRTLLHAKLAKLRGCDSGEHSSSVVAGVRCASSRRSLRAGAGEGAVAKVPTSFRRLARGSIHSRTSLDAGTVRASGPLNSAQPRCHGALRRCNGAGAPGVVMPGVVIAAAPCNRSLQRCRLSKKLPGVDCAAGDTTSNNGGLAASCGTTARRTSRRDLAMGPKSSRKSPRRRRSSSKGTFGLAARSRAMARKSCSFASALRAVMDRFAPRGRSRA